MDHQHADIIRTRNISLVAELHGRILSMTR